MIAELERAQSNAYQNKRQTQNRHNEKYIKQ